MEFISDWLSWQVLLLFSIGLLAAIVGMMFGAAGFILLPSLLLVGIPIHATVAANKFATGISSFTTVLTLVQQKRISWRDMLPFVLLASFGGVLGAYIATRLSEQTMNIIACIVLVFMFLYTLQQANKTATRQRAKPNRFTSFFIAVYDGGIGPGSGLLNITYFLRLQHSYQKAAEMTRFVMFASCATAFAFYYVSGVVAWHVAIPVAAGSIIGSQIGLRLIPYLKGALIQKLFPVVVLVLIMQVIWRMWHG